VSGIDLEGVREMDHFGQVRDTCKASED
jgi:hypothetical protein